VGEKFASARYHDTKRQLRTRFAYILFQLVQYLDSQIIKVAIVHEAFEHLIGGHCWSQSCGTGITTRLLHLSQYFLKPLFAASFSFFEPFPPPLLLMMDQNSPKNSIQKENPKETSEDCLQQRIRPWLPTKSRLQSHRE
jgi:hypothetical protein